MSRSLLLQSLLHLRWTVSFLGEKEQKGWWDTSFLGPDGEYYLGIVSPRTAPSAALHSASVAARRLHDERIGRGRVHHLFRLPLELEEDLGEVLRAAGADPFLPRTDSVEGALAVLRDIAGPDVTQAAAGKVGPVLLPDTAGLDEPLLRTMAAHYLVAFENERQVFPYLLLA